MTDKRPVRPIMNPFTPAGLVFRALVILLLFALAHLAGWREFTGILCGTTAAPGVPIATAALRGLLYVLLYLLTLLAVPVMLAASAVLHCWKRCSERSQKREGTSHNPETKVL